ncbi:MAG: proline dehydrogenase family protein [Actinomycetota bacterium]|nr:proline dehydrogenase family protein [Actinomycetota bacterium]
MAVDVSRPRQAEVKQVAKAILDAGIERVSLAQLPAFQRLVMRRAMHDADFRTRLFRLVDVFPRLQGPRDIYDHARQYLADGGSGLLARGLRMAGEAPLGEAAAVSTIRSGIESVARLFIAGSSTGEIATRAEAYAKQGISTTVDLLGEKTLTQAEAERYQERLLEMAKALSRVSGRLAGLPTQDHLGPIPAASISIKPTALSPHFGALSQELGVSEVQERLRPVFGEALEPGLLCFLDMEDLEAREPTLELLGRLATDPAYAGLHLGVVIQAYLTTAESDLGKVIAVSTARVERGWTPLWVRLVKGAYFDAELVRAAIEGWTAPVWRSKEETDYSYERCIDVALAASDRIRPAFGTHNLRSLSYAIAAARANGIPPEAYEVEMLFGMADSLARAVRTQIPRVRLYLPMGELIPGMSYLVRRLIENTSNESFLRSGFVERHRSSLNRLLAEPKPAKPSHVRSDGDRLDAPFEHHPSLEYHFKSERRRLEHAISKLEAEGISSLFGTEFAGRRVPVISGGKRIETEGEITSVNPADPATVVARSASARPDDADEALRCAREALGTWAATPARERARILLRAADWISSHREELAALEVLEAGKPWREAEGDVTETIDYLELYSRAAVRLFDGEELDSPLGEMNRLYHRAKGIAAVISPWNFPMAIPMGMASAAIATGNTVVLKPAEQTPACALAILRAFEEAGLPDGVLNLLPGVGEDIGPYLTEHPDVSVIAFTGSFAVGTSIIAGTGRAASGLRDIKRVIAEMGGKNAIVVDADADLDQAIPGAIYSAFGFAGQKCSAASRLIVMRGQEDEILERLKGAAEALVIGDPRRSEVQMGPLIDGEALERVQRYVAAAEAAGDVMRPSQSLPETGFFVAPALVIDPAPGSPALEEEIFGPVLCVQLANGLDEAIELANSSVYGLTAGIYSRSPSSIATASRRLDAGNIYINRPITGAIPGRQPFGGHHRSGVGSKAGSPDYLSQFVNPVVVSENTLRQGFVPEIS